MQRHRVLIAALALAATALVHWNDRLLADERPKIERGLPPVGSKPPLERELRLTTAVSDLQERLRKLAMTTSASADDLADVGIYAKAVDFALRFDEYYQTRDMDTAQRLLDTANQRLDELERGRRSWAAARGLVVRGYRSRIDDSYQPYGLVIPDKLDLSKPVPLYVWLHGRGDKVTDLHFIQQRQTNRGQIAPADAIVLHPFGRYCNAFKFAGETDVFEAIEAVKRNYKIDADRIVLWGFSMGGAGAWHLAAHHPDRFCAVSPGAGFAETRRYQNIQEKDLPPTYEQTLWGLYDVPNYTRNLFHLPVVAYSGENDRQIQAARVMEEAFAAHDRKLSHLIGPGMGHAYHPDSLQEIGKQMAAAAAKGIDRFPREISFQTRTLRYHRCYWIEVLGLGQHWKDSRVDATRYDVGATRGRDEVVLRTKNVTALRIRVPWPHRKTFAPGHRVTIDGREFLVGIDFQVEELVYVKGRNGWRGGKELPPDGLLHKRPGLQGPIDDAFMDSFVVEATIPPKEEAPIDAWWMAQRNHFHDRWSALFRGGAPVTPILRDDVFDSQHLVLFGTADSPLVARLLKHPKHPLPIQWDAERLVVNGKSYDAKHHMPMMIYPNPLNPQKYVVLNSGPTFREGHDRTNSQQTPKLPDWAVIDIRTPPDAKSPGKVVAAGFFDEHWQFQPSGEREASAP
jgi:dienelactone hydrolase